MMAAIVDGRLLPSGSVNGSFVSRQTGNSRTKISRRTNPTSRRKPLFDIQAIPPILYFGVQYYTQVVPQSKSDISIVHCSHLMIKK